MKGERWQGELVYVGRDWIQLDADLETDDGPRRVTLEVVTRRPGQRWSEVKVLDLNSENRAEIARPLGSAVSTTESDEGQVFSLSKNRGLIPLSDPPSKPEAESLGEDEISDGDGPESPPSNTAAESGSS